MQLDSRRLRVAVDLDGVLYDFIGEATFLLREHRGLNVKRSDIRDWMTRDKIGAKDWDWLWDQRELFQDGDLITWSKRGYHLLKQVADTPVVTSRPQRVVTDTLLWLALHRFQVNELHILGSGQSKTSVPWDILIDDKTDHIIDAIKARRRSIIFTQPWNETSDVTTNSLVRRANHWKEVAGLVEDLVWEMTAEEHSGQD